MSHIHNFEPNGRCRCGEHIALVPHRATMTDDTPMDLTDAERARVEARHTMTSITSTTCRECGGSGRFRVGYFANHEEFERTGPDEVCGVCGGSGTATMTDNTPMDLTDDERARVEGADRKSTRLNSSHGYISYAVF